MPEIAPVRPLRIDWEKTKCTNCMSCAVVCSERHTGMSAPWRSHIRILVNLLGGDYTAEYCRQCQAAPCAAACPTEAIQFDEQVRAWRPDLIAFSVMTQQYKYSLRLARRITHRNVLANIVPIEREVRKYRPSPKWAVPQVSLS